MRGRRRTPGRCIGLTLSGAVVLTTTACSPIERPLAAVYVDGRGVPQALLRSCDEDGRVRAPWLHGVAVRTTETEDGTRPEASGTEDDTRNDNGNDTENDNGNDTGNDWIGWESSGMHKAADFPLFSPPAHWPAETRGPQSLQPGYRYDLRFGDPDDSYEYAGTVWFDADRLARVPAGRVLTLGGVMTREAFEEAARKAC